MASNMLLPRERPQLPFDIKLNELQIGGDDRNPVFASNSTPTYDRDIPLLSKSLTTF
jgi:hypothetical protein